MPYVYAKVDDLESTDKVGSKQCVALVQRYANAPMTALWKEGEAVGSVKLLAKGTVIATFVNGRYESNSTGNHAAFFVKAGPGGIWIMDQWANDKTKPKVSMRFIRSKGKTPKGAYVDPSNNADAYSVVE